MATRPTTDSAGTALSKVPMIWGNVPQRNKNFTGREDLLDELRRRLSNEVTALVPHALHGLGGVGKTHLAVEYAYRFQHDYDVVWWVPADQLALIRSSLAALANRLDVGDLLPGRVDEAAELALDALRRGDPYGRWLVIFDNVDQPEDVLKLLPKEGHVIVTSRNRRWQSVADAVEVDVFTRNESLTFLARRVPGIEEIDAVRLAEELGDLPLALEQAAALQVESGMTVDEYLEALKEEASRVLAENPPADYPAGVAAAWSLSVTRLKEQMPFAWELMQRLAFFGPEPIERDLFKQGRFVLGPPLKDGIGDPITFGKATRELGRYSLARVDNNHRTLQVHRIIQRLIIEGLTEQQRRDMRHEVHLLLAAADPGDPEDDGNWPDYERLLPHIGPSQAIECRDPEGRRLVRNVVLYLFSVGNLAACDRLSAQALEHWRLESGEDNQDVLVLSNDRSNLLWTFGRYLEAYEIRRPALELMRAALGEEHEETLRVSRDHGADLRARGDFASALELDEQTRRLSSQVFGDDHPDTFKAANNLAVSYALNSRFGEALDADRRTYQDRLDFFGRTDHPWVIFSLGSIARDLRQAGQYEEALETAERAYAEFDALVQRNVLPAGHQWVLWQAKDLSVARRKWGDLQGALDLAEENYQKYVETFGERHPDTLAAAMNVGNARRVFGDVHKVPEKLESADRQIEAAFSFYGEVYGEDHPYTHGCALNLAIVRRRLEDLPGARSLLEHALAGLQGRLGEQHQYTLTCLSALATSLAETNDVEGARDRGQQALDGMRQHVGSDHPQTLACASNLAIDLRALGHDDAAQALKEETVLRYRAVLPEGHFDLEDAVNDRRIAVDFEPSPL